MKYINPGYAEFLDVDGGTTIESATFNPTNGVAFYQPTDNAGVKLDSAITELYGKFDAYIPPISDLPLNYFVKVGTFKAGSTNAGFNGVALYKYNSSYIHVKSIVGNGNDKTVTNSEVTFNFGGINHFYFWRENHGGNGKVDIHGRRCEPYHVRCLGSCANIKYHSLRFAH